MAEATKQIKVVYIGAGSSSFGPAILHDLFNNVFHGGGTLSLVDINAESLRLMTSAASKFNEHYQTSVEVQSDTERINVLADADIVLISAEQDRMNRWKTDFEIPKRFGIQHTLGENRGPSGLSHTLRTAPLVLAMCKDVERLAPKATVIILTNPEDRLQYVVQKYTKLRAYGYCDGLWDFRDHLVGKLLGIPGKNVHVFAAGINHAVWVTDIRDTRTGEDLYPRMVQRARETGWQPFGLHLYETYGLWPHENDEHYGEYFHYACEFIDCKGYNYQRHIDMELDWKERLRKLAANQYKIEDLLTDAGDFVARAFGDSPPSDVVRGLHLGEPRYLPNANLQNNGKIAGLPDDMIVELPAIATPAGIAGVSVQGLPEPIKVFLHREGEIQRLSGEAAIEGSRQKALTSLMLDPHVRSAETANQLLDAFLQAHKDLIPAEQFAGLSSRK
ncbi:MAG TPA: hypothetical protein VMW69_12355 [Spirochaetia bacterium]|nr:hypothetical protein [Spirochaetia bacterium]HUZ18713.1 hypothetical protein [Spirochaetia bacterium]